MKCKRCVHRNDLSKAVPGWATWPSEAHQSSKTKSLTNTEKPGFRFLMMHEQWPSLFFLIFFFSFKCKKKKKKSDWVDFFYTSMISYVSKYSGSQDYSETSCKSACANQQWSLAYQMIEALRSYAHTPTETRPASLCQTCLTPYTMHVSLFDTLSALPKEEFLSFTSLFGLLLCSPSLSLCPSLFSLVSISLSLLFLIAGLNNICLVTFHGELPFLSPLTFLSSPPDFVVKLTIVMGILFHHNCISFLSIICLSSSFFFHFMQWSSVVEAAIGAQ